MIVTVVIVVVITVVIVMSVVSVVSVVLVVVVLLVCSAYSVCSVSGFSSAVIGSTKNTAVCNLRLRTSSDAFPLGPLPGLLRSKSCKFDLNLARSFWQTQAMSQPAHMQILDSRSPKRSAARTMRLQWR